MSAFAPVNPENEMDAGVAFIVKKLKTVMAKRGASGIQGLGRRFKIMVSSTRQQDGSKMEASGSSYRWQQLKY